MSIFILFESVEVLIQGAFFPVSILKDISEKEAKKTKTAKRGIVSSFSQQS